jgi:serine/threonine protein kinase
MSSGAGNLSGSSGGSSNSQGANTPLSPIRSPVMLEPKDIIKELMNATDDEITITEMKGSGHKYVYLASIIDDDYKRIFKILHKSHEDVRLINQELEIYRAIDAFPEEEKKYFFQGVSGRLSNEDSDSFRDYAILNMPYMEGVDLHTFYTEKSPSLKQIYKILKQVAKALLVLISHGISHGDLWAGNIFILSSGDIKLFDFDSAKKIPILKGSTLTEINIARLKYNTIGHDEKSYSRGFFPMCRIIFTHLNKPLILKELNEYTRAISTVENAKSLYETFIRFFRQKENKELHGGKRKKTKKRMKSRRTRLRRTRVA